jgi:hypothetical protein
MADRHSFADWDEPGLEEETTRIGRGAGAAFDQEFYAGERISAPLSKKSRARKLVTLVAVAGSGWGLLQSYDAWYPWYTAAKDDIAAAVAKQTATDLSQNASAPYAPELKPLDATRDVADVPGAAPTPPGAKTAPAAPSPETATSQDTTYATPPSSNAMVTPAVTPLPKPHVDPADPYQKRAAAIGLHPDVSRVLLSSMSDADYRNAATAIRKALAEASDTEKFIWPREQKAKQALFQIHFVMGDRSDCRRYIVTVVKNGWTTTAPPMEKCGAGLRHADAKQRQTSPGT